MVSVQLHGLEAFCALNCTITDYIAQIIGHHYGHYLSYVTV